MAGMSGPTPADPRCCASCLHVGIRRDGERLRVFCRRLGYDTKPEWRFHCWTPNIRIRPRLERPASNG